MTQDSCPAPTHSRYRTLKLAAVIIPLTCIACTIPWLSLAYMRYRPLKILDDDPSSLIKAAVKPVSHTIESLPDSDNILQISDFAELNLQGSPYEWTTSQEKLFTKLSTSDGSITFTFLSPYTQNTNSSVPNSDTLLNLLQTDFQEYQRLAELSERPTNTDLFLLSNKEYARKFALYFEKANNSIGQNGVLFIYNNFIKAIARIGKEPGDASFTQLSIDNIDKKICVGAYLTTESNDKQKTIDIITDFFSRFRFNKKLPKNLQPLLSNPVDNVINDNKSPHP